MCERADSALINCKSRHYENQRRAGGNMCLRHDNANMAYACCSDSDLTNIFGQCIFGEALSVLTILFLCLNIPAKHVVHAGLPSFAAGFKELDNIGGIAYGHLDFWPGFGRTSTARPQGGQFRIAKRWIIRIRQSGSRNGLIFDIVWTY